MCCRLPPKSFTIKVAEKFQIYSVKITVNTLVSQKIESVHFYSWRQAKLSHGFLLSSRQTGIAHFSRTAFFEDIFYRSQVLINSTIFATFIFLLCNNLASSMLKCEGSLTYQIKFSLKSMMCRNN